MRDPDCGDLRSRCLTRDPEAMVELWLTCQRVMQKAAQQAGLPPSEVEDLSSELFASLVENGFEQLRRCQPRVCFNGWLYWRARGYLSHLRRAQAARPALVSLEAAAPPDSAGRSLDDVEATAIANLERQALETRLEVALTSLSPAEREAFVLYAYCGLTTTEIAGALKINPSTAQKRCARAKLRLRQVLTGPKT